MEKNRVIRSAFKIGGITLLSRFLGLARDTLTASVFATSSVMSDFTVAFRLPNLFRALFGEGALSSAFVPVYVETRDRDGAGEAWALARRMVTFLGVVLIVLSVAGVGILTALIHFGFGREWHHLLPLMRIMLPYVLFICLTGLLSAMLNAHHRFSLPAAVPSLFNLTWIVFVLVVCPRMGDTQDEMIYGLAWGVIVAGMIQLAVQLPPLIRLGFRARPEWAPGDARVRRVFRLMAPTALGLSVTQVNVMISSILARWAAPWAPAALFYAERLLYFPQGILATAMSTVLLPVLSGHAARDDRPEMLRTINHSLRTLLFVMIPAAVGLAALARPLVAMLLGWGNFGPDSIDRTTIALQVYAPGLFVFCLAKVFVPAFYALKDTKTPFRIGLRSVGITFTLNVIFVLTLPQDIRHAGLAGATVISEAFNGLSLGRRLHQALGNPGWSEVLATVGRALGAAVVMAAVCVLCEHALSAGLTRAGAPVKVTQIISVLAAVAAGAGSYFAAAAAMRAPEVRFVREALQARRRRSAPPEVSENSNPGGS